MPSIYRELSAMPRLTAQPPFVAGMRARIDADWSMHSGGFA